MSICGIDFSSRAVHLVLLDDDTDQADMAIVTLEGQTPFERARSMRRWFPTRSWWEREGVYLIGIEAPFSRSNQTAKALGMAAGAIAALLPDDLTVVPTSPVEWKRVFCGDPSASKEIVALHVRAIWPDCPEDAPNDITDAYGIAWAVRQLNERAVQKASVA